MMEQEKAALEKEIRQRIAEERRAYKAEWRKKNRQHINEYNRAYYRKRKGKCEEVAQNAE